MRSYRSLYQHFAIVDEREEEEMFQFVSLGISTCLRSGLVRRLDLKSGAHCIRIWMMKKSVNEKWDAIT